MAENYEIDNVDRQILHALRKDARRPFLEIAREITVSGGTVHVRFARLQEAGIITGTTLLLDYEKLGFDVTAFIGVNLKSASDYRKVLPELQKMPEIIEAHYTTGSYSIFIKVVTRSTRDLHDFLIEKLQSVDGIQSTETFISLERPIFRDIPLD